jgi:hypothetical protein
MYSFSTRMGLQVELPMVPEIDNRGGAGGQRWPCVANSWSIGGRTRHVDRRMFFPTRADGWWDSGFQALPRVWKRSGYLHQEFRRWSVTLALPKLSEDDGLLGLKRWRVSEAKRPLRFYCLSRFRILKIIMIRVVFSAGNYLRDCELLNSNSIKLDN